MFGLGSASLVSSLKRMLVWRIVCFVDLFSTELVYLPVEVDFWPSCNLKHDVFFPLFVSLVSHRVHAEWTLSDSRYACLFALLKLNWCQVRFLSVRWDDVLRRPLSFKVIQWFKENLPHGFFYGLAQLCGISTPTGLISMDWLFPLWIYLYFHHKGNVCGF